MPYAQTWTEELVAEWLQLQGYMVEIKIPATKGTGKGKGKGGRTEPDVVGARIRDNGIEIIHVEVGNWPIGEEQIKQLIAKKFAQDIQDNIKRYFADKLNVQGDLERKISYKKVLVAVWLAGRREEQIRRIEEEDHSLKYYHLSDLLLGEIPRALEEYGKLARTQNRPEAPSTSLYLVYLFQECIKSITGEKQPARAYEKLKEIIRKHKG